MRRVAVPANLAASPREAEALLRPLVNSPHGGDLVERARVLMKRVQAALAAS